MKGEKIKYIGEYLPQPCDMETEQAVLATLMRYDEAYNQYGDLLSDRLFNGKLHKAVFAAVDGVLRSGGIPDINSLFAYTQSNDCGYELTRSDFAQIVPHGNMYTFRQDLDRLIDLSKRRQAWHHMQVAANMIYDLTEDADMVISDVIRKLEEIREMASDGGVVSFKEAIAELSEIVHGNIECGTVSLRTGFKIFDEHYLLRSNTLTVIAAFTSVGKSALAMNIAKNVAKQNIGVAYYSLEMGKSELAARGISGDAGVPSSELLNKKLGDMQLKEYERVARENENLPIFIDEKSTASFDRTIRSIRTLRKSKGIGLAIIDYLQIYTQVSDNTEDSLAYMARAAKNLAKELCMPLILLSQLNRSFAHPSIRMLRGSGQIEESADNVILIDRPEAYPDSNAKYEGEFSDADIHGTAKFILGKGRGVGTDCCLVRFDGRYTQFYEDENNALPYASIEEDAPF